VPKVLKMPKVKKEKLHTVKGKKGILLSRKYYVGKNRRIDYHFSNYQIYPNSCTTSMILSDK
jgi:hypothetical protein